MEYFKSKATNILLFLELLSKQQRRFPRQSGIDFRAENLAFLMEIVRLSLKDNGNVEIRIALICFIYTRTKDVDPPDPWYLA
jgi:hypothetical protein